MVESALNTWNFRTVTAYRASRPSMGRHVGLVADAGQSLQLGKNIDWRPPSGENWSHSRMSARCESGIWPGASARDLHTYRIMEHGGPRSSDAFAASMALLHRGADSARVSSEVEPGKSTLACPPWKTQGTELKTCPKSNKDADELPFRLGASGLKISKLILGCMTFGSWARMKVSRSSRRRTISASTLALVRIPMPSTHSISSQLVPRTRQARIPMASPR
jgi:hypothetical protein